MRVVLNDEGSLELRPEELQELSDQLWLLAPRRGAVSAVGKLQHAARFAPRSSVVLDEHETLAFNLARERLHAT